MNKHTQTWLTRNIFGFGVTSFFNDMSHEMTTVLLPTLIESIIGPVATPTVLGLVGGISDMVSSTLRLWAGWLSDRIAHHKALLVFGYTLTPVFVALMGTANHIWQIVTYRTIAWVGKGIREPVRDAWMADIVDSKYYGKAFGFTRALDTLGAIIGPLAVFYLLSYISVKNIFLISLIPGLCSVLALYLLVKEKVVSVRMLTTQSFTHIFTQLNYLPANFRYFVGVMFLFGLGNFHKTLIIFRVQEVLSAHHYSFASATGLTVLLYTFFNTIRAISEFSLGALSDYVNRKALLAFCGFGFFALVSAGLLFQFQSLLWWALIFLLAGVSTGTVTALEKAYAADLLPAAQRGTGYGFLQALDGLADLIASVIVGLLWTYVSVTAGCLYAVCTSLGALALFYVRNKAY